MSGLYDIVNRIQWKPVEWIGTEGVKKYEQKCSGCSSLHFETSFYTLADDSGGDGIWLCKRCTKLFINFLPYIGMKVESYGDDCEHFEEIQKWCEEIPYDENRPLKFIWLYENNDIFYDSIWFNGLEFFKNLEYLDGVKRKGVYFFYNRTDEEFTYIGSSNNIIERIKTHLGLSKKYDNGNKKLYFDFYKFPKNYCIGWTCYNAKEFLEYLCIDKFKPKFNILGRNLDLQQTESSEFFWK